MLLRQDRALLALDIALDVAFHASHANEVTGAAEIATRLGLARRGIEPLLQALVRAGLLHSLRGPRGGYRPARPAREVTVAQILSAATEEDAAPTPATPLGRLAAAVTLPLWQEFDAALIERAEAVTLEALLQRAQAAGLRRPTTEALDFVI
jgi:Rrf2 family protein